MEKLDKVVSGLVDCYLYDIKGYEFDTIASLSYNEEFLNTITSMKSTIKEYLTDENNCAWLLGIEDKYSTSLCDKLDERYSEVLDKEIENALPDIDDFEL